MFICHRKPTEGQLSKWTNLMKGWQFRWFTLDPDSGLLEYYVVRTNDGDLVFIAINDPRSFNFNPSVIKFLF